MINHDDLHEFETQRNPRIDPPLPGDDSTLPLPQSELDFNEAAAMLADPTGMIQLRDMLARLTNALRRRLDVNQSDLQLARRKLALECLQYIRLLLSAQDSIVLEENEIAIKNLASEVRRLTK